MTWVYYAVMGLLLALGIVFHCTGAGRVKTLVFLGLAFVLLTSVSALRYEVGDDYYNYMNMFVTVRGLPVSDCFSYHREPGFFLLIKLVGLFTGHFQWFYAVVAALTTALVLLFILRESKLPFLSVTLYITLLLYYWSLSLIRQMLAAAIFALGVRYIRNGRLIPFVLLTLLCASVHSSALIMLPVYFLARIPFNGKTVAVVCTVALLGFIFAPQLLVVITRYIYTGYNPESLYGQGAPLLYGLFPTVVFAAAWCFKRRLLKAGADNRVYLNLALYAAVSSLFIARVYIAERFAVYFFLPAIVLVPNMLCTLRPDGSELEAYRISRERLRLLKGSQKAAAQQKTAAQTARMKDARVLFGFAVGLCVFISLLYHLFAFSQGFYHVQDYQTVLNKHPTERFSASRALYRDYLQRIGYPV